MSNINIEYLRENCFEECNDGIDGQITHDDGYMNIGIGSIRYVFDIGQGISNSEYNLQCNKILRESGINKIVSISNY